MTKYFYSNGKLLLSGEYAILDGAEGWAVPTKFGQSLKTTGNKSGILSWKSLDADGSIWFQASYNLNDFTSLYSSNKKISDALAEVLVETRKLEPGFLESREGCLVETELTFSRNWRLGSSSTLINNIANWAKVNPYILLSKTFGGSGYDIACAQYDHPIVFKINNEKPMVRIVQPELPFSEALYFVYLNQKKNSREAITAYRNQQIDKLALTTRITELTEALIQAATLVEFEALLNLHETILSNALNVPTIKEQLFPDYPGSIKSLGGWGGDFVMVTAQRHTLDYFKQKGYHTIVPFSEMVL